MLKSCCVTGHRKLPQTKKSHIRAMLEAAVIDAFEDGYRKFYSGMALGVDLLFVDVLAELRTKSKLNFAIEGVLAHRGRLETKCPEFNRLVKFCDNIHVTSESKTSGAFHKRNKFMVDNSQLVIAVYDGRITGGTFYTMKYAELIKRELKIIPIE